MIPLKFFLMILWRLANVVLLCAPTMVLCAFARPTHQMTTHYGQPDVQRYRLPAWARWAESPDEHLPGGLYEPTVAALYAKVGWYLTSVYWVGLRNVGNGIVWGEGREVPMRLKDMTADERARSGLWVKERKFWKVRLIWGWEVTRDWHSTKTDRGYWASPILTLRFS